MRKTILIKEYGSFTMADNSPEGFIPLCPKAFNALESFILSNRANGSEASEFFTLSAKKGVGKIITAKNYVGVISMKDGTTIEILPKVYSCNDESAVKKLLIKMLKALKDSPFKAFSTTNVNVEEMNIFEIFVRMFIDETMFIVKRGLRSGYQTVQRNEGYFKGKLKVSEHIKYNYIHKERNYIEYDEFNKDRPENRLIKSTLLYLYSVSKSIKNRTDIKNLLCSFSETSVSDNYTKDFQLCSSDRNMKDYTNALLWCKVFLFGKTFTTFSGSEIAFALLFPMDTVFESYIAKMLKASLNPSDYAISVQDRRFFLFDDPRQFLMKPDIVVRRKKDGAVFIFDTKWKLLSASKPYYGISQADMYQMYAYQMKYKSKEVTLLYPLTDSFTVNKNISYKSNDGAVITVRFIDLFDMPSSLGEIISAIS